MFQYALGRRLADERGVPLGLDLSWFRDSQIVGVDAIRAYALDGWRIRASVATSEDLARVSAWKRILARLGWAGAPMVTERGLGFDARVLRAPSHATLVGYWQSEKYFKTIRETLLREFTLAGSPCPHVQALLAPVRDPSSVAIHVRRGDYADNLRTNAFHGLCPIEYYLDAVHRIAARVPDPSFFVFSDDLDWARDELKLAWPTTYVAHDGPCTEHQDLWLMSRCSHHVIANSTFGWWGAWLCPNDAKIVIAPRQWFRNPPTAASDLVPESWTRIEAALI